MRRLSSSVAAFLLLPAVGFVAVGAAAAQSPGLLLHEHRAGAGGVAVSVHFPVGHFHDPPSAPGTAFLLGRVLEAEGERRVAPHSGRVHVEVAPQTTVLTLFAPSDDWLEAWRQLAGLLSAAPLPDEVVAAARNRLVDEILFQSGAPVRAFEREWRMLRFQGRVSGEVDLSRPPEGTVQGVGALTAAALQAFRTERFDWGQATVAVVGGARSADVGTLTPRSLRQVEALPADTVRLPPPPAPDTTGLAGGADTLVAEDPEPLPPALRRIALPAPPLRAPGEAPAGAGSEGERRLVNEEITSTWIGIAWRLPEGTPHVLGDFLVHVIAEALNPSPPDPGLYRADVRIEEVGGQPLLVVVATVDPQATYPWEERILRTLEGIAAEPPPGAFFELARRQYRASRLLESADPALRARWLAARGAAGGEVPSIPSESWALTREGLADLAQRRGPPRILLYGPQRMMSFP
jgi:hypothetical protein